MQRNLLLEVVVGAVLSAATNGCRPADEAAANRISLAREIEGGDGPIRWGCWSNPVNVGSPINSAVNDQHPAISKDGLSLYITSDRPGGLGGEDIWVSHRESDDAAWGEPVNLGPNVNSSLRDRAPTLSIDGHALYFHSSGRGGCGGADLFVSRRQNVHDDLGWQPAENLGCVVNSPFDDAGPTVFEDEETGVTTLYFTSTRPGGPGDFDVYASTRSGDEGSFGPPVLVAELSGAFRDTRTAIRRDGLEMFLSSDSRARQGGQGDQDIWVSTRATTSDPWSVPVNLNERGTVNSSSFDGAPALSFDATTLYFYSARPGGVGANDLYRTARIRLRGNESDPNCSRQAALRPNEDRASWTAPVNLGAPVNSVHDEFHSAISRDGLTLYTADDRPHGFGGNDIWISKRADVDSAWSEPTNLGPTINGPEDESGPNPSPDGHFLYFASRSFGGYGGADLFVSHRADPYDDFAWEPPVNLGPIVNSPYDDVDPNVDWDGGILYFGTNRPGGLGGLDIWQSALVRGEFQSPVLDAQLSSPLRDARSAVSSDGREMFLASDRPGGFGGIDLWISTRASRMVPWSIPVNLGEVVNSAYDDRAPSLSADGATLYFTSDRRGGLGKGDFYSSTRVR
jgi:WD40-like Beta Propeller Repeat